MQGEIQKIEQLDDGAMVTMRVWGKYLPEPLPNEKEEDYQKRIAGRVEEIHSFFNLHLGLAGLHQGEIKRFSPTMEEYFQ